jgi:predicted regulator of Ras-like GTPase activity (Roadblock/LC7/MglB family)
MRRVAEPPRQRPSAAGHEGRPPAPTTAGTGTRPGGSTRRRPETPRPPAPAPNGRGPAPLPVRGAHVERPNPAEAMPGVRPDDRRTVAENVAAPPTPRAGAVRGTMGKPQLPRRRAQEHIAPQLRGGPAAPRPESEHVEHDPGLMAAFQRGIGLAEARQLESDYTDPAVAAMERAYEAEYGESARAQALARPPAPSDPTYAEPRFPAPSQAAHPEPVSVPPSGEDAGRTDVAAPAMDPMDVPPMDTSPISEAHRLRAPGHDLDLTARHPTPSAPAALRTPRSRSTMASDVPTGHVSDLDWLMSGLVQRVPHTTSAVLLSCDGLVKSVHGLDPDSADHMAALASGLYSLGRSAGVRFGDGGEVRQVVVELDSTLLFVTTAGSGTCLAVLAGREADAAVLGYEMAMLVKSVRPYLMTAPRQSAVEPTAMRP